MTPLMLSIACRRFSITVRTELLAIPNMKMRAAHTLLLYTKMEELGLEAAVDERLDDFSDVVSSLQGSGL